MVLMSGAAWPVLAWVDAALLVGAAEAGDLTALRRLRDAGVPVDERDARRRTALLAATQTTTQSLRILPPLSCVPLIL